MKDQILCAFQEFFQEFKDLETVQICASHYASIMKLIDVLLQYFVDYKLATDYTKEASIPYATYFLQYIGFAAQVPNVIFNWINVFLNVR